MAESTIHYAANPECGIVNLNGREPSVAAKLQIHQRVIANHSFRTNHRLILGDARHLRSVHDESVHLVVTSPPYFDLVSYSDNNDQLGHIHDYPDFLSQLDLVWQECFRTLIPGGRLCVVVGDVCRSRRKFGRHEIIPLHADILVRCRALGFEGLATVFWYKIANATTEVLQKAMIKQIDRVRSDLVGQVDQFHRGVGNPICVGIVGVNHAAYCVSYEGDRQFRTDGRKYTHPCQEAEAAEERLRSGAAPKFDEFLVLQYRATNEEPYPFECVNYGRAFNDYGAILARISRTYDARFGGSGSSSIF